MDKIRWKSNRSIKGVVPDMGANKIVVSIRGNEGEMPYWISESYIECRLHIG